MKALRVASLLAIIVATASSCHVFGVATENYVTKSDREIRQYIIELTWLLRCTLNTGPNRPPIGTDPWVKWPAVASTCWDPADGGPDGLHNPPPPPPGWPGD